MITVRKILRNIDWGLNIIARTALFLMVIMVFVQVFTRYVMNDPIGGVVDVTEQYFMPILIFFSISYLEIYDGHVRVDLVYSRVPQGVRRWFNVIIYAVSTWLFLMITWASWTEMLHSFRQGYETSGDIRWPQYTALVAVPVGCLMLALRLFFKMFENLTQAESLKMAAQTREDDTF